jgi:probable rRNA maturation factor
VNLRVDVQRASVHPGVPDEQCLRRFAGAAAGAAGGAGEAEMTLRIVDLAEGVALNRAYRGKAGPTNVLSFPFDAPEHTTPPLLGDVVLCAPVVAREAAAQGKALDAHYAHLVVHGVLHLLGHVHERDCDAARMEGIEREVLGALGYPDPYAARAGDGP